MNLVVLSIGFALYLAFWGLGAFLDQQEHLTNVKLFWALGVGAGVGLTLIVLAFLPR